MIVDQSALPLELMAPDGTILYASGTVGRVVGWEADQLVGHNMAEFLAPDQLELAVEVIAEIEQIDRGGVGVPMVFAVQRPSGDSVWVEIGAMPLLDVPGVNGIVLRLRPWDAQYHLDQFLGAMLANSSLDDVLAPLTQAIAALLEAEAVAVCYGFDGTTFAGAVGSGMRSVDSLREPGLWSLSSSGTVHWPAADVVAAVGGAGLDDLAALDACWVSPVPGGQGLAPAVLSVWRAAPGPPLAGHRHGLQRVLRFVQLALVRTAEHERLQHLAAHDPLTGVANRGEFRDRLARALAIGERDVAVAFCDVDRFKPVNDTFGHRVGDQVLVQVVDRMRSALRAGDELARAGGDEFTVLLRNVPTRDAARDVAERLVAAMHDPFDADGHDVHLSLSVGIALTDSVRTADELLARADAALYDVKRAGGDAAAVAT